MDTVPPIIMSWLALRLLPNEKRLDPLLVLLELAPLALMLRLNREELISLFVLCEVWVLCVLQEPRLPKLSCPSFMKDVFGTMPASISSICPIARAN